MVGITLASNYALKHGGPGWQVSFQEYILLFKICKRGGGEIMLVEALKNQWICSCGNWVDKTFQWCPECCEEKLTLTSSVQRQQD